MNLLDRIHPKLVPYVAALRSHKFGLRGAFAKIENVECGSIVAKRERKWGDRFQLKILYCERRLSWQVIMCPNNLMEPPDFILEDDFLADANHDMIQSHVPSLANWQPSDPKCLLNVVLELLELYKQFQCDLLTINKESRMCFEYDLLMHCAHGSYSDLEILVHNASRVSFLFHLKVDFSKLPIVLPKQKYLALLLVELEENMKTIVSLIPQEELNEVFENINLIELNSNMILVDYVRYVEEYIQAKVIDIVQRLNKRKLFYSYLVQALEPALLNGDNITFRSISFLLEHNNNYFLLNIEIPLSFPEDPPDLHISLMKKPKSGATLFVKLKKFHYSPSASVDIIFSKFLKFIKNAAIQEYYRNSSNNDERTKNCCAELVELRGRLKVKQSVGNIIPLISTTKSIKQDV